MKRKLLPLIGIAFVVALISTAAFYSLFAARMGAAPAKEQRVGLVTAARALAPGTVLKPEDLSSLPWSGGEAPVGAFTSVQQVAGQATAEEIPRGELILASRLVSREGASAGIPEGMRAVSVHVSDSAGVVGMLKPGHKVDLQVFGSRSPEERRQGVRTLLRGVPVLAVRREQEPSSQGYFSAPVITVLVSVTEAEQLAFADSFLRLRIALRNPREGVSGERAPGSAAPPVDSAGRRESAMRLVVRTFGLSEAALSNLAKRLDRGVDSVSLSVSAPDTLDLPAFLAEWNAVLESEKIVYARGARLSYFDLPRTDGGEERIRVGLAAGPAPGQLRIRPETRISNGGRAETRSLETEVRIGNRRCVIVSGFGSSRVVVISAPEKV